MKTDSLATRLNIAMTMAGMTQGALAKASGVSQPTIWRLTKGQAAGSRKLVDIAAALNVNVEWLAKGQGEMQGPSTKEGFMQAPAASDVPVWTLAGKTSETIATPNGVRAKKTWRAYLIGSIVIVDTDIQPESGDLVIARVNERISVYRYLEGPSNGFLTVDDPRLPAVELSPSAELIGVAIFLIRDLRR